jgi:hypothetical protein
MHFITDRPSPTLDKFEVSNQKAASLSAIAKHAWRERSNEPINELAHNPNEPKDDVLHCDLYDREAEI